MAKGAVVGIGEADCPVVGTREGLVEFGEAWGAAKGDACGVETGEACCEATGDACGVATGDASGGATGGACGVATGDAWATKICWVYVVGIHRCSEIHLIYVYGAYAGL